LTTTFSPDVAHPWVAAADGLPGLDDGCGVAPAGDEAGVEAGAEEGAAGELTGEEDDDCPPAVRDADPHAAASTPVHSNSAVVTVGRAANGVMADAP
jgi:hypothetical protein